MIFFKKFSRNLNSKENAEKNKKEVIDEREQLRAAKKARKDAKSYDEVKAEIDAREGVIDERELKVQKECFPIEDFYSLSDSEIIEELHDLTQPIYPILDEIKIKQNDWMPDEEMQDYKNLKSQIEDYFLFDNEDLNEIISGFLKFEDNDEDEEEPYGIRDHLNNLEANIGMYFYFYDFDMPSKFSFIEENLQLLQEIKFEFLRIYWSAFGIDENLIEVTNFWNKYPKYSFDGTPTKRQKERYEVYQKAYFYSKKDVVRAAKIFKRFEKEKTAKINGGYIPSITKDDYSSDYGFVYFIRNKDIHKIGITQNMLQRMEQLKPDELLDSVRCSNYKELEREIHNKFKGCRIPQTEYFRLEKEEIAEIHQLLKDKAK